MTVAKARVIFATHMQAARKRKLTAYELRQLGTARQVLRQSSKPAMNPLRVVHRSRKSGKQRGVEFGRFDENPKGVLIYGQVDCIYATKKQNHVCDDDCKAHGHRYFHKFKSKPKMYGLPDGSLLIKP